MMSQDLLNIFFIVVLQNKPLLECQNDKLAGSLKNIKVVTTLDCGSLG